MVIFIKSTYHYLRLFIVYMLYMEKLYIFFIQNLLILLLILLIYFINNKKY